MNDEAAMAPDRNGSEEGSRSEAARVGPGAPVMPIPGLAPIGPINPGGPNPELAPADWTTADEIRRRSFAWVDRGFDADEVREYLAKIADWFSDLHVQLSRLRKSQSHDYSVPAPQPVGPPPEEASALAARMADLLRDAEEHAAKVRAEADERVKDMEDRAKTMVAEAEERASTAVADAEARAQQMRSESGGIAARAKAEAEERVVAAESARAEVLTELRRLRERLIEAEKRLEAAGPSSAEDETPEAADEAHVPPIVSLVPDRTEPSEAAAAETPPTAQGLPQ